MLIEEEHFYVIEQKVSAYHLAIEREPKIVEFLNNHALPYGRTAHTHNVT